MSGLRAAAIALLAISGVSLSACSSSRTSGAAALVAPRITTPLSTSVESTAGTWATIAMGRLDQPLNTFWQLFFRPADGSSWSDQVEATAVATNGGLVLAPGRDGIVVGVEPTNDLTFSPIIESSDAGSTWSNGLLTEGLADRPQSLAYGGGGQALALVRGRGDDPTRLLESAGGLSSWRTLVSQPSLAAAPGARPCAIGELTAVSFIAGSPVVGASCARTGVVGILAQRAGAWELIGPPLPSSLRSGRVEVLAMMHSTDLLTALVGVSIGTDTDLVAAWSANGGQAWVTSQALAIGAGSQLASVGAAGGDGLYTLLNHAGGSTKLDVVDGPGSPWVALVSPPRGTATVAFAPGVAPEALVVDGATLNVWTLDQESTAWIEGQRVKVPIQYGSSS